MKKTAKIWMVRVEPTSAPQLNQPLGFMYLASALRKAGFTNLRIIDMAVNGVGLHELASQCRTHDPDVIAFTVYTVDVSRVNQVGSALKGVCPNAVFVIGGPHVTGAPVAAMQSLTFADFACVGEGEETFVELMLALRDATDLTTIKGLVWRSKDRSIVMNPPRKPSETLDEDLFPAYDLIRIEQYFTYRRMGGLYKYREYMSLFTSRGCPYSCVFCHRIFGRVYRAFSAERVLDEMEYLWSKHGIKEFQIVDDLFNGDRKRFQAILNGILERNIKVSLCFPNGLRADALDREHISLLSEAGTFRVCVAPETASKRLQKQIQKNVDLDRLEQVIEWLDEKDIIASGFFMLGFPSETEEEMDATIKWALNSRLHTANFYRVLPNPGTELRDYLDALGLCPPYDWSVYEAHGTPINLSSVPDKVLEKKHRDAYRAFYSSPRRLFRLAQILPVQVEMLPEYTYEFVMRTIFGTLGTHVLSKGVRFLLTRATRRENHSETL